MKKSLLILFSFLLVSSVVLFGSNEKAQAATYSGWQHPYGFNKSCKVRVITDASTYTKRATTVDAKVEQNGNCGKLYYRMYLAYKNANFGSIGDDQTGEFSSSTPWKSFSIRSVKQTQTTSIHVHLSKKKNSGYGDEPRAYSKSIKIYGR
ncbi:MULTISPECIES: hypothetical protein [Bacillus]|uniref:hypothetical protein n=1 Tax=Bacillus TaxID=1386 RepID=UPI0002C4E804|nr:MULTISPECIES: hypothetical protein [Bacillus]AGI28803.1 hypothetical protein I653_07735 [Bacillus subtilis subsp. subtilis str. BAB-1]ALS82326.1 hypothetical protein AT706_10485 [Bacillus subtilis subsp. subtilis]ASK23576.1 hypothetical protein BSSX_1681 [Bacillus subtilis]MDI6565947.1 hypothetical protein [Bacillus subtilis]PJM63433.1 hypothetical protein BLX91_14100 [Bacillus subtilis]